TGRNPAALYSGSTVSTRLKVMGVDLAVMGDKEPVDDDDEVVSYSEPSRGIYKKLILRRGRIAGAMLIGDGAIVPSLLQAFAENTQVAENRAELLFATIRMPPPSSTTAMPDAARICDCNNVSKAEIVEAVLKGARSVQAVCDVTRASTGCGSCRPEVEAIVALACQGLEAPEPALPDYGSFVSVLPGPSVEQSPPPPGQL